MQPEELERFRPPLRQWRRWPRQRCISFFPRCVKRATCSTTVVVTVSSVFVSAQKGGGGGGDDDDPGVEVSSRGEP